MKLNMKLLIPRSSYVKDAVFAIVSCQTGLCSKTNNINNLCTSSLLSNPPTPQEMSLWICMKAFDALPCWKPFCTWSCSNIVL